MALAARHLWVCDRVSQSLGLNLEDVKTFVLKRKTLIDPFFTTAQSKPKIFFFYQARKDDSDQKELFLALGMMLVPVLVSLLFVLRSTVVVMHCC